DERRPMRALLAVREGVVRGRARWMTLIQALLRREGVRVRSGSPDTFVRRVEEADLPEPLQAVIAPLLALFAPLNTQLVALDEQLGTLVYDDRDIRRLTTAPGVGPVTAVAFVATVDVVARFRGAHQVESYLGLVPREWSSSETQRKGRITKAGNGRARWLLVEAAWCILRRTTRSPDAVVLRDWAARIARRRGSRVAVVALARRLAGILYAMWRDQTAYDRTKLRSVAPTRQAA